MTRRLFSIAIALAALSFSAHSNGHVGAPRGFRSWQTDLTLAGWFGGFDYLPDGRLIVSDSNDVFVLDEDGTKTVVAHFEEPGLFGSFVEVQSGNDIYVGESSMGTISRFGLGHQDVQSIGPGTRSVVAEIPFNYDMDFDPLGYSFVSAAIPELDPPANGLFVVHAPELGVDVIARLPGWSGPLAFDEEGNLFYCTSTSYPPESVEKVIFFRRDQVQAAMQGTVLTEADAHVLVSGIYGFSDMVFVDYGHLFGVTSSGQIMEIRVEGEKVITRLFASVSPDALGATVVRLRPGRRAFEPYYQDGGTLTFLESDFGSFFRLVHLEPSSVLQVTSLEPVIEGLKIGFSTEEGKAYQAFWSDDPGGASGWHPLGDTIAGQGTPLSVVDPGDLISGRPSPVSPLARRRFYRVRYAR